MKYNQPKMNRWVGAALLGTFALVTLIGLAGMASAQVLPAQNQVTQSPFGGLVYSISTSGTAKLSQLKGVAFGDLALWDGTKWITVATSSLGISASSGIAWPFTPTTYAGVPVQATTSPLWFQATNPFSIIASSSFTTHTFTPLLSSPANGTLNIEATAGQNPTITMLGNEMDLFFNGNPGVDENGGQMTFTGNVGNGTGSGGTFNMAAGNGGVNGNGGQINFVAGQGGATSGTGGDANIIAGAAQGVGQTGGNLNLTAGAGDTPGKLRLKSGGSGNAASLDTSVISGGDKTYTFPNQSGTFCLVGTSCDGIGTSTNPFMATYFVATSTIRASQFPSATSSLFTVNTNTWFPYLATPAGTVLAVDSNGKLIATTTSTGTITNIATTFPIQGGPITTTGTITFGGLATTSPWTAGQVAYVVSGNRVTSAATGTVAAGTGISVTGGQSIIGSGLTITNTLPFNWPWTIATTFGTSTNATTTPSWFQLGLYASSTSQFNNSSTTLATIGTEWLPNLAVAAGTVLAVDNNGKIIATTTSTGTVTSITAGNGLNGGTITTSGTIAMKSYLATSSAETSGQLSYWTTTNGTPATLGSVATGTISAGTGISLDNTTRSAVGGALQITNSGVTSLTANAPLSRDTATGAVTISCSTCVTTSFGWPWTIATTYATSTNSTSTPEWFRGIPYSLFASSTAVLTNASTTNLTVFSNTWLPGVTASRILGVDNNNLVVASTSFSGGLLSAASVPNTALQNSSVTINTNAPLGGGGAVSLGSSLTLTCTTCATTSFAWPWVIASTYGTTTNSTTTPEWFRGGLFASSTATIPTLAATQGGTGPVATFIGGNVGIGTTTPAGKLSVTGTGLSSGYTFVTADSNNSSKFVIQDNGFVGIGNSSPSLPLVVNGDASVTNYRINLFPITHVTGNLLQIGDIGGNFGDGVAIIAPNNNNVVSEVMRFAPTGNVGVGTTSPWANFSIAAPFGNTFPVFTISTSTQGATSTAFIVDQNGLVGIGTTTPGTAFSIQGVGNFVSFATSTLYRGLSTPTLNVISTTATSTFANGITLSGGCVSIRGVCLSSSSGTVTSITGGLGLNGGTITTSGTLSLKSYIATSSSETSGNIPYWTSSGGTPATLGTVATGTLSASGPITVTAGTSVIGGAATIACATCNTSSLSGSGVTGMMTAWNGANSIFATSTIIGQNFIGTSTTATSTFAGGVGIGTTSPINALEIGSGGSINVNPIGSYKQNFKTILYASTSEDSLYAGELAGGAIVSNLALDNAIFGTRALPVATSSAGETAIGAYSLNKSIVNGGGFNTAVGYFTLGANTFGTFNTALGSAGLGNNTTGTQNTSIGYGAGQQGTTGSNNTYLGYEAGEFDAAGGHFNAITGNDNIVIGTNQNMIVSKTASGQLNIGNLIFGTGLATTTVVSSGKVGIGSTTPNATLAVQGNILLGSNGGNLGFGNNITSGFFGNTNDVSIRGYATGNIYFQSGGGAAVYQVLNGTGLSIGNTATNLNRLDVLGGAAIGSYATVNTAPSNGLIVSGNVGVGTTTPIQTFSVVGNGYFTGGIGAGVVESTAGTITATNLVRAIDSGGNNSTMQVESNFGAIELHGTNGAFIDYGAKSDDYDFRQQYDLANNLLKIVSSTTDPLMTFLPNGKVGIGIAAPTRQVHIYGSGQATAALTDAGNKNGTLYVQDAGGGGGNGGAIVIGANEGLFAGIKGLLTDGSNNSLGDLAFSTRAVSTDSALTERMRIQGTTGNVGIGVSSPGYPLTIQSNSSAQTVRMIGRAADDISGLSFTNNAVNAETVMFGSNAGIDVGGSTFPQIFNVTGSQYISTKLGIATTTPTTAFGSPALVTNGLSVTHVGTNENLVLNAPFSVAGAVQMASLNDTNGGLVPLEIRSSQTTINGGNVGIGTTTPAQVLAVTSGSPSFPYSGAGLFSGAAGSFTAITVGRTGVDGYFAVSGNADYLSGANPGDVILMTSGTGRLLFSAKQGIGSAVDMAIASTTGNVGIGTTSPAYKLEVIGDGTGSVSIGNVFGSGNYAGISLNGIHTAGNNAYNILSSPTDENLYLNRPTGAAIRFREGNASDSMYMAPGGNIGIATSSPASILTVLGHIGTDGARPAVSLCGTSPSIVTGSTDTAGQLTQGSVSTGCTITFASAYARAPFCTISDQAGLTFSYSVSASAITVVNIGALSSTAMNWHCTANDL